MRNYIKPEFEVHSFDIETSIMDGEATATPVATVAPQSANILIKDTGEISKKYYSEYKSGDGNDWNWTEQ